MLLYALLYWLVPVTAIRIALAFSAFVFLLLIARFFRNPHVVTPEKEGVVYAPADGKVVVVERTYEGEWHKGDRIQVSIFMSPLNVHVNRSPVKGTVCLFQYHPGKYLVAWHPKSSIWNERTSIGLRTMSGVEILMRQIAGTVARRIAFYPKIGDKVRQGASIGFIRFGSRVDLFLPLNAIIKVKPGALTKGGVTEVAVLKQ